MERVGVVVAALVAGVAAISLDQLFPYGLQFGDSPLLPGREDAYSMEVKLSVPLNYFQREHLSIFVNENGLVSFVTEISTFYSVQFPMEYPIIAPFYADIDTRGVGQVYWRASSEDEDLTRAANLVQQYYWQEFSPREVVVVTWDQVGYYEEQTDKTNMVQLILASDGQKSFAVFLYPEGGIKWVRGQGKNRNQLDPQAQAGFMSGEGQSFLLPPSGLDQIANIEDWSNTDVPGLWIYRIGPLDPLGTVEGPEEGVGQVADPRLATTCTQGKASCHSEGQCIDHRGGFCCQCGTSWYGDGRNCLREGVPQRVNGRVNGQLNGVSIEGQDLHCYVVTADGRTYTAISRIPSSLGWHMQGLVPLGTVISWLFANSTRPSGNGFSLTGGVLNYTAEVTYPNTGDKATILFVFKGMDVFDYLKADVTISGSVPPIPQGAKIKVEDQTQEFSHSQPGLISAEARHSYSVEGAAGPAVPYTVQQTIQWDACRGDGASLGTNRLAASRNFIIYDEDEGIVRYAMTSTTTALEGAADPCREVDCGPEGLCLVVGGAHKCDCRPGYTPVGSSRLQSDFECVDVDECLLGSSDCSHEAVCTNTPGGFSCACPEGYIGDGRTCQEERTCTDLQCHPEAKCTVDRYGQGQCICNSGLQGDGFSCQVIPSEVSLRGYANPDSALVDINSDKAVSVLSDLGPSVNHYVEVTNYGPYDIGNMVVNLTWPLKNKDSIELLYLTERPFTKYFSGSREWQEECSIDPQLVNPRGLGKGRVRRQEDLEYGSLDGVGVGVGALFGEDGLAKPNPLDQYGGLQYDDPEYDYSHLDIYNRMAQAGFEEEQETTGGEVGGDPGLPGADRIVQKDPKTQEAPTYEGDFSRVSFFCRVNLAASEMGVIHIPSRLVSATLASYPGVTTLSLASTAALVQTDYAIARGNATLEVETLLEVRNPLMNRAPGRGVHCGTRECHKYASCVITFKGAEDLATCSCPEGFFGDGETSCQAGEPEADEERGGDCRTGQGCGDHAECTYQETGVFACQCSPGFEGDPPLLYCRSSDEYEAGYPAYPPPGDTWSDLTTESWLGPLLGPVQPTEPTPTCRYGVCECPAGLVARGSSRCVKDQPGLCSAARDCHSAADCVYSREGGYFRCECLHGYVGDGRSCRPGPDADCRILHDCHQEAVCIPEGRGLRHYCRCQGGFQGNGTYCEQEVQIGCNVLDNCGRFANCHFIPEEGGFLCLCDSSRGFEGDGYTCSPRGPCSENPAVCDPNADCLPTPDHSTGCRCKAGFLGDGFECEAAPRFQGNFLLLAQGMFIFKVPLGGRGSSPINVQSSQVASGIDIDCMKGDVYWSDTANKLVRRAGIDGKGRESLISSGLSFPEGLAVDWVSRNLYITDPGRDTIEVASLEDGARVRLLAEPELAPRSPRGVAVHPGIGKVFWTDWDRSEPKIEMANMDGTGRQTLVDSGLGEPNSLAVDYSSYEVCWADAGSSVTGLKPRIECVGVNGAGRRLVLELPDGSKPYGIGLTEDSVVWTDWNSATQRTGLQRADKQTGVRRMSVKYNLSHLGKPYDLVNVPSQCPPGVTNSCQGLPCGRGRLCLPDGRGSHSCCTPVDGACA